MWAHRYIYLLLLPAVVFMALFHYLPLYGVQIAFKHYSAALGIWNSPWYGLHYFRRMFREYTFLSVLRNTLTISGLRLALCFPSGVLFALILNEIRGLRLKRSLQTISYLPHFFSWVVVSGIIRQVLALNGPVNALVGALGGEATIWLSSSKAFVPILILSDIWKSAGWGSIIYLAAITAIPADLYESASLDGASALQRMRFITLPGILPVVLTLFIIQVGHILNAGFDQVFNLYSPMVYSVADILDTYVYRVGLQDMNFSYSAAIGLFKNLVGFLLLLVVNTVTRRKTEYGL